MVRKDQTPINLYNMGRFQMKLNVAEWIVKRASYSPGDTAIIFEGKRITYGELNSRVNSLSRYLLRANVKRGDRVAALLHNSNQLVELYFACAKIGAIMVPMNYRLVPEEILYLLSNCGAVILFYHDALKGVVDEIKPRLSGDVRGCVCVPQDLEGSDPSYEGIIQSFPDDECLRSAEMEEPVLILYTSGTTGRPKGAVMSHRKTLWNMVNLDYELHLSSSDVALIISPQFHTSGLHTQTLPILYKGGTAIIHRRFDPAEMLGDIERYRVTYTFGVPTMLADLLRERDFDRYDLSTLRFLMTGAAPVPLPLIRGYLDRGIPLIQGYGMTEASVLTLQGIADAVRRPDSAGRPVFHCGLKVTDDEGKDLPPGQVGEVRVKGPVLMSGYWNMPEETEERMRDGWFSTGDLAYMDDQGFLYIVDRKMDMFISGGENVYPAEVERVLIEHPKVDDAAVVGVPDQRWGEVGKAFIVLKPGMSATGEEMLGFFTGRLARYKIPKHLEFVEALPRNTSGKVVKNLLRERLLNPPSRRP